MKIKLHKTKLTSTLTILIGLMFLYAALSKLLNYEESKREMINQVFPHSIALVLVWAVPAVELLIVAGLMIKSIRIKALSASVLLLAVFSLYISITMTGVFGRIPCSCGGILKHMSYSVHLAFNLFFILLALLTIIATRREFLFFSFYHDWKTKGGRFRPG